ncbi:formate dehydrogenase accessory sulfurtransferase FdhD [Roseateles sp. BYS180W]|uniref:Sulfur carrier protein FdhD n=1 Tax=Roseateles rivi TaxID=3299028 RepID=A0ABW7FXT5_9BURK
MSATLPPLSTSLPKTDGGSPLPEGLLPAPVWRYAQGCAPKAQPDVLAEEVPVAFVVDGITQLVMLATPADLEDLALGLAYTEGWITQPQDVLDCEPQRSEQGWEVHMRVMAGCAWQLQARRRAAAGRTGCGLCGADSLAQVRLPLPAVAPPALSATQVCHAMAQLQQHQTRLALCGATHAAAWCDAQGQLQLVREDVGRHNALDKLIGALLRQGTPRQQGMVVISSRASFEMVQKTARAGMGMLAAVSAPTHMAVEVARDCGLTLLGFVRGNALVAYTPPPATL